MSIVQHDYDAVLQQHMIKMAKADGQFSIRETFLPRTTAYLFTQGAWFGLDRVYLCQLFYQIMEAQWAVQDSCFNCCLDDLVVNDELEEEIAAGAQKYSATTLVIMRILQLCKSNTPFSISEVSEIEGPLQDYLQNIPLK